MGCAAPGWKKIRATGPRHYDGENTASDASPLHPARVITELRRVMPRETVLVVDSGAHRAFCGHYWEAYAPRSYISATNLGPMGWAIPGGDRRQGGRGRSSPWRWSPATAAC